MKHSLKERVKGSLVSPLRLATLTNLNMFTFSVISTQIISGLLSTKTGTSVTVDWGDGTSNTYSGTDQAYSKDYGSVGNRTVVFKGGSGTLTKFAMTQTGANISFDLVKLPRSLTYFSCLGSNTVTGNLSSLPIGLTSFTCTGSNTITGNLSSLPTGLTTFACTGSNTVTGNLSSLPAGVTYFTCTGLNTIGYYSGKTWANNQRRVYLTPVAGGGLSSAEIDQLLIDLAAAETWTGDKVVYLRGTNAARTSASDAAVATLVNKGVTVTTT